MEFKQPSFNELFKVGLFALTDVIPGDLGDVGNQIGIAIAELIDNTPGYQLSDFIDGVHHGVSLIDGTH